jgi:argininosuccinate synthase
MKNNKKVVLAFSGGLDTSFCAAWLNEQGFEVITVFCDTGGHTESEKKALRRKALALGAARHYAIDCRRSFYDRIGACLVRCHGLYQNEYPLLCSDRYVIVEECCKIAEKEKADRIAHGCTAMGNDQVRFDVSIRTLGGFEIIAPIRDLQQKIQTGLRSFEAEYLKDQGFPVPARQKKYTVNQNLFGVTISGGEIDGLAEPEEDAFVMTRIRGAQRPRYVEIGFDQGRAASLNGKRMAGHMILDRLNRLCGPYGIGRFIYTGDCVIGIKGRIAFECPGLHALIHAHRSLSSAVLSREQNQFQTVAGEKWTGLVYSGLYFDPLREDLEKFILSLNRFVTGKVLLKLETRRLMAVQYSSPYRIRGKGVVYAQSATWSPSEAAGFTKLYGLAANLAGQRKR